MSNLFTLTWWLRRGAVACAEKRASVIWPRRAARTRAAQPTRLVAASVACSTLILAGCSIVDHATGIVGAPDDRIRLGAGESTPYIDRRDTRRYTCSDGTLLRCETIGLRSKCRCERIPAP